MKRASVLTLLSILVAGCTGDVETSFSPIFEQEEARLGAADKRAIFDAMTKAFPLSDDGATLVDPNCGDIAPNTEIVDLNTDGTYEVFIEWGNACLSGHTGRSLTLFVKDGSGTYRNQLGFPAFGYETLGRGIDGYPDLQLGGPGFCFAIWAWDGLNYEFKCNLPQTEGGCESGDDICWEDN